MFSPAQHPAQQQVITILLKRNNVPKTRFPNNVEWVDPLFPENIIWQKLFIKNYFSNTFLKFYELYHEEIISLNSFVKIACILHPYTFPEKANRFLF